MTRFDFERFTQRLSLLSGAADVFAAADRAGIEVWDTSQALDTEGRTARGTGGMVDPRTGDGIVTAAFPPSATRPPDYPTDWPFVANAQAWITELRGGGGMMRSLAWTDVPDPAAVSSSAFAELTTAGWTHQHDPEKLGQLSAAMNAPVLAAFRRGTYVRILVHMQPDADAVAAHGFLLFEVEKPTEEQTHAAPAV